MLKAIAHGKMAPLSSVDGSEHSARQVYRDHEDHLSAAVFARLSYLPTDVFWLVLLNGISPVPEPIRNRPRLKQIEFWPRYAATNDRHCEPDALLQFERFDILVEAKRRDNKEWHTADQVQAEINAYRAEYPDRPSPYCLLVSGQIPEDIRDLEGHAGLLATSWLQLRLGASRARDKASGALDQAHWVRALKDIEQALSLHGVRPRATIADLDRALVNRIVIGSESTHQSSMENHADE